MDVGKAAGWELAGASDRSANAAYVQKAELGDQKFLIAALVPRQLNFDPLGLIPTLLAALHLLELRPVVLRRRALPSRPDIIARENQN